MCKITINIHSRCSLKETKEDKQILQTAPSWSLTKNRLDWKCTIPLTAKSSLMTPNSMVASSPCLSDAMMMQSIDGIISNIWDWDVKKWDLDCRKQAQQERSPLKIQDWKLQDRF